MEHDSQLVSSDSENEIENINTPEPESEVTNDEFDNTMNELYDNDPNLSMHSENNIEVFVTWLCVFIALWQYSFGITDTVIDILIKFLKTFLNLISLHINSFSGIAKTFPSSLYTFHKYLGYDKDAYKTYVVCVKCFNLYSTEDAQTVIRGANYSRKCNNVLFSNHPNKHYRKECGQILMQEVKTCSGKKRLVPLKTYVYKTLRRSISEFIKHDDFERKCSLWRERARHEKVYCDVFDGSAWKGMEWLLSNKRHFGFMHNIDWFCPYRHVKYISIGVIYLVCLNLCRSGRFKRNNVVLVGIIPSMKKEPKTNSFLKPLIDELLIAWTEGFDLKSPMDGSLNTYKAALVCVGCDIPAARKVGGVLG